MKKLMIKILLAAFVCAFTVVSAYAADLSDYAEEIGTDEVENSLPDSADELMGGIGLSMDGDYSGAVEKIIERAASASGGILRSSLKSALLILMAATLCSVASVLYTPSGKADYVQLAGVLAVAAIAAGDINTCVGLGKSMINELSTFSKVLLPTLTGAAAFSGAVTSSAAKYAAAALFMDILITVVENVLIPIIYAYIAAVIAECAIGGEGLSGAASLLKWLATSILTLIVLAFVFYLSASGIVSGTADAASVRVAKTALSTGLPVVGGIISDAANTVLVGASVVKNTIGVFGLLVVLATCILPLLRLTAHYLMYKFSSKLSAAIAGGSIAKAANGIGGAFGMIMGASGACAMMLFFSIFSFIKAVV